MHLNPIQYDTNHLFFFIIIIVIIIIIIDFLVLTMICCEGRRCVPESTLGRSQL